MPTVKQLANRAAGNVLNQSYIQNKAYLHTRTGSKFIIIDESELFDELKEIYEKAYLRGQLKGRV